MPATGLLLFAVGISAADASPAPLAAPGTFSDGAVSPWSLELELGERQASDPADATAPAEARTEPAGRDYLMQANVRARYMTVPQSILDIWYFDSDDAGANPYDRPKIHAWAVGGEYVFQLDPGHYVIYGEYIKSMLGEGYFDDVEEPADHDDGDWIRPDGLGVVDFGFNYFHEVVAVPIGPDHGSVGLSFLFGAGLGVGFLTGGIEQWHPGSNPDNTETDCRPTSPAYDRYDACASDGYKRLPGVIPMVDIIAAMRVNFANHAHIRLEGGVHDMFFFGASTGGVF